MQTKYRQNNIVQYSESESYQQIMEQEIRATTRQNINAIITPAVISSLIALLFILAPFSERLRKFHSKTLPRLFALWPVILGAFITFVILYINNFLNCFKKPCAMPPSTMFTLSFLSAPLTIPFYLKIRKRQIKENVEEEVLSFKFIIPAILALVSGFIILKSSIEKMVSLKILEENRIQQIRRQ